MKALIPFRVLAASFGPNNNAHRALFGTSEPHNNQLIFLTRNSACVIVYNITHKWSNQMISWKSATKNGYTQHRASLLTLGGIIAVGLGFWLWGIYPSFFVSPQSSGRQAPPPPAAIRAALAHPGPWGMVRFRAIAKAGYLPNPEFSTYPFRDFWQRWHLVTVRYRTDIKELRWVYANKKAWNVLIHGGHVYPIGSRIAKIAYNAIPDRLFPDSLIPSAQAMRIQMMVKVPSKTPVSFAGWQYAIYYAGDTEDPAGALPGTTKAAADFSAHRFQRIATACAACHTYVGAPRGQVFSQPAPWFSTPQALLVYGRRSGRKPIFSVVAKAPAFLVSTLRRLHITAHPVHYLDIAAFAGTFVEMKPFMVGHARTQGGLWILKAKKAQRVAMAWRTPTSVCTWSGQKPPRLTLKEMPPHLPPAAKAGFLQAIKDGSQFEGSATPSCTLLRPH